MNSVYIVSTLWKHIQAFCSPFFLCVWTFGWFTLQVLCCIRGRNRLRKWKTCRVLRRNPFGHPWEEWFRLWFPHVVDFFVYDREATWMCVTAAILNVGFMCNKLAVLYISIFSKTASSLSSSSPWCAAGPITDVDVTTAVLCALTSSSC